MAVDLFYISDLGSRQLLAVLAIADYGSFITAAFLKTLPIIKPALSHNLGLITLKEREPTPATIGICTLICSVWSRGRD